MPGVIDHAVVLVRDGRIESVGPADAMAIPAGYQVLDLGDRWIMPGLVELHSHVAGTGINDAVYQTNPGLRASPTVVPDRTALRRATAGGITTLLYIPGSATNLGGQGVLLKPGFAAYDEMLVREPGSVKIAQGDNPKRWGYGMQRTLMAWNLRQELRAGMAYARRWESFDGGVGEEPERVLRYDIFRDLLSGHTQVSTHTQYYKLVLTTILMLRVEFGLDVYIDHGSFDSYKTAALAEAEGVPAILGPREIMWPRPTTYRTDGRVEGSAWGFQKGGLGAIGFNTDAPVVPQEELSVQAAMGVRYGLDNSEMAAVRGLTIIPAETAGIADRVGSIEPGKDADLLVVSGDPSDPRTSIELVMVQGRRVYDTKRETRLW